MDEPHKASPSNRPNHLKRHRHLLPVTACLLVFIATVAVLQMMQADYDARNQFISELALGRCGEWLRVAFATLAVALSIIANGLRCAKAPKWLTALPFAAAISFLAAGEITLSASADTHITLVAIAFVCCATAMYTLSRSTSILSGRFTRTISWSCTVILCGAIGLGSHCLDVGLAQRVAASALFCWLCLIAWRLDTT